MSDRRPFQRLAERHFQPLESEFGFSAGEQSDARGQVRTYTADWCEVRVSQRGSQIYLDLGAGAGACEPVSCDLYDVMRVRNPAMGFHYNFDPDGYARDPSGWLDAELSRLAALLFEHCQDMLRGDFSILADLQAADRQQFALIFGPAGRGE